MRTTRHNPRLGTATVVLAGLASIAVAAGSRPIPPTAQSITSPTTAFGFAIGDDYQLANFSRMSAYWRTLDAESDRIAVVEYGRSSEGRPMLMAVVTSPANHARLDHVRAISRRLALADGLGDEEARRLAAEGRTVVWIDAGLHATEVANAQALTELIYQMAARDDAETRRVLDDVILLAALSNPDGLELVADWYMREPVAEKRSLANLPVLYQKYIGHDNNRESLLMNMPESEAIGRVLYREWFPQIVFNQHQSGPAGAVLYVGHMRDPSNPFLDPLMAPSMELVSAAIHTRFVAEGKPGAVNRSMASYQNWWNGGVRSTACFHNQIAILSEITGSPTPTAIGFVPRNLVATNDNPFPVEPQVWRFRQAIDYLLTASRAVLDVASDRREDFLFNVYRMGRSSIDRGSRDTWTMTARKTAAVEAAMAADGVRVQGRGGAPAKYFDRLRDPAARDPRGYVIPSDQPDFPTAVRFVNALIKNGITVHRATQPFAVAVRRDTAGASEAGRQSFPAGSFVVKTAQAFRPHILDNFEPQDYPNDFAYPGGPPVRPYDVTGYTLAYQMGVVFDRAIEAFDGPFEPIEGFASVPPGVVSGTRPTGFLLSHQPNASTAAVNRLLAAGEEVYWLSVPHTAGGPTWPPGTVYVPAGKATAALVATLARELGVSFDGVRDRPEGAAVRLAAPRIAVVDVYGGSMTSGWMQWLLGQFAFPFEVVFPPALDEGGLRTRFDVIIVEHGLAPAPGRAEGRAVGPDPASVPAEFRDRIGAVTETRTTPALRQFLDDGGTIIAIGSSTSLAGHFGVGLPGAVTNAETGRALPPEQFYVPGAILRARADTTHPLAYGMPRDFDLFYNNNPLFRPAAGGTARTVVTIDPGAEVRSGWAWGLDLVKDAAAVVEIGVGRGRLLLYGPQVAFRAHPHGTFKLLFNGIHYGASEAVTLRER